MKTQFTGLLIFCCSITMQAQLVSSNLPIVIINTPRGQEILNDPRILANMKIIDGGPGNRNLLDDENNIAKLNFNGLIHIEARGSASLGLDKKQYALTTVANTLTELDTSLLGMPAEHDWILNGIGYDHSLIRDYLFFNLSRQLGNYAARQEYCELVLNGNYRGLYILTEKIKIDKHRVDLAQLDADDNKPPNVTGGYIILADHLNADDLYFWTMPSYAGVGSTLFCKSPSDEKITLEQRTYIVDYFRKVAAVAKDPDPGTGYPSLVDIPSFIDFMLINELASNDDAYEASTYFHKDKSGKLRAGPVWDLNLSALSPNAMWQFDNGDRTGPKFFKDFFGDANYRCYMSKRWNELIAPGQPFNLNSINTFIDQTLDHIKEASTRDSARWIHAIKQKTEVKAIKDFLIQRTQFITESLGSPALCTGVTTAPLVISRIHYNPKAILENEDDSDLEFIEITNAGNDIVPLNGIYFSGTGLSFQFPKGRMLPGKAVIQMANNADAFERNYGYMPYGHFSRNLSNASQKITLSDAFGNMIDEVTYSDSEPWPDADGNGMHLKLTDLSLNNNEGANWIATNENITSTELIVANEDREYTQINIFPNPGSQRVHVKSSTLIDSITVRLMTGQTLDTLAVNEFETVLELTEYPPGIYVLAVSQGDNVFMTKLIKQ